MEYGKEGDESRLGTRRLDGPLKDALRSMGLLEKMEQKSSLARLAAVLPDEIRDIVAPVDIQHGELILETPDSTSSQEVSFFSERILDAAEEILGFRPRELRFRLKVTR